ncbi:MAG TPA: zf-HC2 domain-containing protein [Gaiellaceae bacterium]|jgi:predicted anti-sigma-YlaC factor YlaD|nr:zf-HC2 domain-containing protein [Gaiellaceae bacterium]
MSMFTFDPCEKCEQMMQPYLDRVLTEEERAEAEVHLQECSYCRKRYRFEEEFRQFVRLAVAEPMSPELKAKLRALRTPL